MGGGSRKSSKVIGEDHFSEVTFKGGIGYISPCVSFIPRLKKKYAIFSPGQCERGAIFNERHARGTFSDKDGIWDLIPLSSVPGCTLRSLSFCGMLMRMHCWTFFRWHSSGKNKQASTETFN